MERLAEARGATQELKASVPSTTITANSIPTAPTNILFIINNLWEVEGALAGSGLVPQRPEKIHRPELSIVSRFEIQ
jgi:hypothetical protein